MTAIQESFIERLRNVSWFSAVGAPITAPERSDIGRYIEGLGINALRIETVASWIEARSISRAKDWDVSWWEAEERYRLALREKGELAVGKSALLAMLTEITMIGSNSAQAGAAVATSRSSFGAPDIMAAAAGAAGTACYQAALELVSLSDGGPFLSKFRLYEAGRWPLCVMRDAFYIF